MKGFRSTSGGFDTTLDHVGGGTSSPNTGSPQALAVSVSHAELKALRDGGNLVPGTWYRITDYLFTTTQEATHSAGRRFDIIVRADDGSHLNENAYAAHHEGDGHFAACRLEAWELKYCIDNDGTRFGWADPDGGRGVVHYMRDEWGNEAPFDFKNVRVRVLHNGSTAAEGYVFGGATDMSLDGTVRACRIGLDSSGVFSNRRDIMPNIIAGAAEHVTIGANSRDNFLDDCSMVNIMERSTDNIISSCSFLTVGRQCSFNELHGMLQSEVHDGCTNVFIRNAGESYRNIVVLPGTDLQGEQALGLFPQAGYCQYVGNKSAGGFDVWCPADNT